MMKKWLVLLGLTCWGLTSCQPASISPTSTIAIVSATNTPQPTNTFLPTSTLTPTFTPVPPTPTIIPPDVLTRYLKNVRIVNTDPFDRSSRWGLDNEVAIISNGLLRMIGKGENWSGGSYETTFQEGNGILIDFKFTQGADFEMFLGNGIWDTNSYKRFGVYLNHGNASVNLFSGQEGLGFNFPPGNLYPKPDTWYSIFMVSGKGGDFLTLIWDPASPEKVIRYRDKIEKWKDISWSFSIQVYQGTIIFDNFAEIKFDGIK